MMTAEEELEAHKGRLKASLGAQGRTMPIPFAEQEVGALWERVEELERKVAHLFYIPLPDKTKTLKVITQRDAQITLLEAYSKFLEDQGYLDIDWRAEAPYAIDEFLKTLNR